MAVMLVARSSSRAMHAVPACSHQPSAISQHAALGAALTLTQSIFSLRLPLASASVSGRHSRGWRGCAAPPACTPRRLRLRLQGACRQCAAMASADGIGISSTCHVLLPASQPALGQAQLSCSRLLWMPPPPTHTPGAPAPWRVVVRAQRLVIRAGQALGEAVAHPAAGGPAGAHHQGRRAAMPMPGISSAPGITSTSASCTQPRPISAARRPCAFDSSHIDPTCCAARSARASPRG